MENCARVCADSAAHASCDEASPAGCPSTYIGSFRSGRRSAVRVRGCLRGPHVAASVEKPVVASAPRFGVGESAAAANDFYLGSESGNSKEFRQMAQKT